MHAMDPSVGVRGGLQTELSGVWSSLRISTEVRADLHGGPVRPLCVPRATILCRELAAAPPEPRSVRSFVAVRLLDLQLRAHRAHRELKRPRFLANKTCAESTLDQDIPIAVYMTKYSGYERNKPGLIFGFLKNGT